MICRVLVTLILLLPYILFGQDPGFSQFFSNPLHLNPALTGASELPRIVLNYRNQWPQKGSTYTTYSVSFDQISKKLNTGFGLFMHHDQELNNVITSKVAAISYSYHIELGYSSFMTLGL